MTKAKLVLVVWMVLAGWVALAQAQQPKSGQDPWAGTWTAMPGVNGSPENTLLLKEGDGYRLDRKPYESYTFKETAPGVLECKSLGKIYRGKLTLDGRPGETAVLKAELCYEVFYLLYQGPSAAPVTTRGPSARRFRRGGWYQARPGNQGR